MTKTRQQVIEEPVLWIKHALENELPEGIEKYSYPARLSKVREIIQERIGHAEEFHRKYASP